MLDETAFYLADHPHHIYSPTAVRLPHFRGCGILRET